MGLGEFIGGAAATAVMTPINYWLNKKTAEQNQEYYRENMAANYAYSQAAQRNAAGNEVAGLRQAGLSPVLANGAAAAPIPAAQGGTQQSTQIDPANLLLMAQIKNLDAQSKKSEAEAENIEQKTGESKTAGKTASMNLSNYFSKLGDETKDPNLQAFYYAMADEAEEAGEYSSGALASYAQFNEFYAASFESRRRAIEARFEAIIAEGRESKAGKKDYWYKTIVDLPYREVRKIGQEISNIAANTDNLKVLKKLNEAKTELTEEEQKRVEQMKKKLEDYNIAQYIKNGDSLGALAAFFGLLLESAATAPAHFNVH